MSLSIKAIVVQSGANAVAEATLPTGLVVDGKQGWNLLGMQVSSPYLHTAAPATANSHMNVQLNTESSAQGFLDNDSVYQFMYQFRGVAASTSGIQVDSERIVTFVQPRLTVQPNLYINVSSAGMTVGNTIYVEVFYEIVKLTDIEVMRLMQGGA